MRLYAVYDTVAETVLGGIQMAPTDGVAVRAFSDAIVSDEQLKQHPGDYCLLFLGDLDLHTGTLVERSGVPVEEKVIMSGRVAYDMRQGAAADNGALFASR